MTAIINTSSAPKKECNTCGASIHLKAEICPSCGVRQLSPVSKTILLLLTFFLGGIGAHKFYLGKNVQGVIYFLFFWTGIPGLISLIEFIIYACTSSDRLNEKYSARGASIALIIVLLFVFIFVIGILAAIAIPAYADYTKRAKVHAGLNTANQLKAKMTEVFMEHPADMSCSPDSCTLTGLNLTLTKDVQRVSSDKTGLIVIEYAAPAFPEGQNKLTMTPIIDGQIADLSDPANANKALTWECGKNALTTLAAKNLPAACR